MKIRLFMNSRELELTQGTYSEGFSAVETVNTSEAGTRLRAVARTGIPQLDCSYKCDDREVAFLEVCSLATKLNASRWSESTGALINWSCYMSGFSKSLIVETPTSRIYSVNFSLIDLEV